MIGWSQSNRIAPIAHAAETDGNSTSPTFVPDEKNSEGLSTSAPTVKNATEIFQNTLY